MVTVGMPALARRLAAEGVTVVLVGQDAAAAGEVLAAIEAEGRGRAAFFRLSAEAPAAPAAPGASGASEGPTGSELDALLELLDELWPPT